MEYVLVAVLLFLCGCSKDETSFDVSPDDISVNFTIDFPEQEEDAAEEKKEEENAPEHQGGLIETGSQSLDEIVHSGNKVCIVFGASWCVPCQLLKKRLEELSYQRKDVMFYYADIDKSPQLKEGITLVPIVKVFDNGAEKDSIVGNEPDKVESAL